MKPRVLCVMLLFGAAGPVAAQSPSAAAALAREYPDRARDSIATAVRAALGGAPGARAAALTLAEAYAAAWRDPFPLNRARWLVALEPRDAERFLTADSLRRRGSAELFGAGPARARATWRAAERLFADIGDSVGGAAMVGNVGAAFYEEGSLDSAAVYLEAALVRAERLGDHRAAGNAATILGNVAWERSDLRSALQYNLRAAALHRATGNYTGVAADHNNAGLIAEALRDDVGAEEQYRAALAITEVHGSGARVADQLVNLGGLAARHGELDSARRLFGDALTRYRAAGEAANEGLARRNLGMLEAGVGAYDGAIAQYEAAIERFAAAGRRRDVVDTRRLLASVFGAIGRPDEALEQLAAADTGLALLAPPDPALASAVALVRGDVALTLNRDDDARASYAAAERLARLAGGGATLTAVGLGRAQLALRRGRYGDVIRDLEPLTQLPAPGRDQGWIHLLLGIALAAQDDADGADGALEAALAAFTAAGDRPAAALALGQRAAVDAAHGRPHRALRRLADARTRATGWPALGWWLHLATGRALEAGGDEAGALAQYDSAAAVVEGLADWVRFDDRRATYMEDKWEPYLAAAALRARAGDPRGALDASERLRARHLLDLLASSRAPSITEGALRSREQYLRSVIGDLTAHLVDRTGELRGPAAVGSSETREALLAAQTDYRRLLDRMRTEEPDYVRELRGAPAAPEAIQHALAPDQILLEYLVGEDDLWIFAVTRAGVRRVSVGTGRTTLRAQVDFARWALADQPARRDLWGGALRSLYDVLLRPLKDAGLLAGHRRVIVAPHRELHYLPFEALIDSTGGHDRYLVETHDVAYVPSASVWLRLRARDRRSERTTVLALAPTPAALAGTGSEMDAIARVWGGRAVIRRGAAAHEGALDEADGHRIVHLATRGVLNRHNPLFSFVELAPGPTGDGRLEVHEVFRSRLTTDLLVLSACQTALGSGSVADVPNGDDWIGLQRAFLYAGANNVLATLWAVDDRRTAAMAELMHRRFAAGDDYAAAVAGAKREALRHPGLRHPYYWAGFVLTGAP